MAIIIHITRDGELIGTGVYLPIALAVVIGGLGDHPVVQ